LYGSLALLHGTTAEDCRTLGRFIQSRPVFLKWMPLSSLK